MSLLSRLAVQAARAYGMLVSGATTNVPASYLVVAGGGGGAAHGSAVRGGGGGGAGGYLESTVTLSTLNTYSVTVGAGGTGTGDDTGSNGSNSVLSGTGITTVTATGGGVGRAFTSGVAGGSGGGGGYISGAGGAGTSGQGNNGGAGGTATGTSADAGGGGGGAGGVGGNGTSSGAGAGGTGGAGIASSISGTSVSRAGGGGGGNGNGNGGTATAGGGTGGSTGSAGTANTGGGGGGRGTGTGGAGGSGIVIISYTSATPKFVGGTLTTSGGNQIHTFTSSGTLSPITPITASYLVVAGGGGAGAANGGGGGAGGFLTSSTTIYSGATYVVTVGAGGNGGAHATGTGATNGGNSVLSGTGITTITATGGGRGGSYAEAAASGGSGGGASNGTNTGGTGTSGQGNNGGSTTSTSTGNFAATGGGGAGAAGASLTGNGNATNGGIGLTSSITGTSTYYAGGGGGGANGGSNSSGGLGGGGAGAVNNPGTPGTANTGGGGGGSAGSNNGALGGSGIVIISYAGSQQFNGGLVTTSGGNTIHTFTSTGALTPLTNNLNNSLRFRSSASATLSKTLTTPTLNTKWTWSAWVKLGTINADQDFFIGGSSPSGALIYIRTVSGVGTLAFYQGASGNAFDIWSTDVLRDPSAWYHLVVAVDLSQSGASKVKFYKNGTQMGSTLATNTITTSVINSATSHSIGGNWTGYFNGYMTDINFIDGQALEPYYFGNNDANGVWKPILYKGTYGTNGFYLTFGNTTSTTTLGYDSSPNGNNWTCNNISLTAGTTYDAMTDVPTNTSATVANYAVLNSLYSSGITYSEANLRVGTGTGATTLYTVPSTIGVSSGKWYWETILNTQSSPNITLPAGITSNAQANKMYAYATDGKKWTDWSSSSAYGATFTTGDVIGVALDMDGGTLTFYKNGVSQGAAFTGLTGEYFAAVGVLRDSSASSNSTINFGQRPFNYSAPSGFLPLNTFNL